MDLFSAVQKFHQKFDLPSSSRPSPLPQDLSSFRLKFMYEELLEYEAAVAAGDLEKQFDALIDLVYVALGTAYLHGFPFNEGFSRVQEANLKKMRAHTANDSKRGSAFDVVKPEGWEPPDLSDLVG